MQEIHNNIGSYSFNIVKDPTMSHYIFIRAIGHENHTHSDPVSYCWDCRQSETFNTTICILQYTVSGEGVLEFGNKMHHQKEGDFFLIERPGPYKYYLAENSENWEIYFIEFSFEALPIWNSITQSFGRTFRMNNNSELMHLWLDIFHKTEREKIQNSFKNSTYAYRMILTLHRYLSESGTSSPNTDAIQQCVNYIEKNFSQNISLTDIAAAGNLSPFYVNKAFKTVLGDTPIHYLSKTRIKYSMRLLSNTALSIDEIAIQCGFQNANYFAKVFRKYVNMTPSEFRKQEMSPIIL